MNISLYDARLSNCLVSDHQHLVLIRVYLFSCCGCLETEGERVSDSHMAGAKVM